MADYIKKQVPLNLFEKKSNLEKIKVSTPAILRRIRQEKNAPKINKVLFLDPKSKSIIRMPIPNNLNINISDKNKFNLIIRDINNLKNKIQEAKKKKEEKKKQKKDKKQKKIKHKNAPSVNPVKSLAVSIGQKKKTVKI